MQICRGGASVPALRGIRQPRGDCPYKNYDGTVMIVSHDRYFISQVANKIVEIRDGEFRPYLGDYHYYLDKIAEEKEIAKFAKLEAEKNAKKAEKEAKKKATAKQK